MNNLEELKQKIEDKKSAFGICEDEKRALNYCHNSSIFSGVGNSVFCDIYFDPDGSVEVAYDDQVEEEETQVLFDLFWSEYRKIERDNERKTWEDGISFMEDYDATLKNYEKKIFDHFGFESEKLEEDFYRFQYARKFENIIPDVLELKDAEYLTLNVDLEEEVRLSKIFFEKLEAVKNLIEE